MSYIKRWEIDILTLDHDNFLQKVIQYLKRKTARPKF